MMSFSALFSQGGTLGENPRHSQGNANDLQREENHCKRCEKAQKRKRIMKLLPTSLTASWRNLLVAICIVDFVKESRRVLFLFF